MAVVVVPLCCWLPMAWKTAVEHAVGAKPCSDAQSWVLQRVASSRIKPAAVLTYCSCRDGILSGKREGFLP